MFISLDKLNQIATGLAEAYEGGNLKADSKLIASGSISTEDLEEGKLTLFKSATDTLNRTVSGVVTQVLSTEEHGLIAGLPEDKFQAGLIAAQMIGKIACDPAAYGKAVKSLKPMPSGASMTISHETFGIGDVISPAEMVISAESYDGQQLTNAVSFSMSAAFAMARQDEFAETLFPTIIIDPLESGISIDLSITSYMKEIRREISGAPDAGKYNKVPVVKAVFDRDIIFNDKNKAVPVFRTESQDVMLADYKWVDKSNGEEITTAPLKIGKTISLLGISQTPGQIAKGQANETDALDRTISIQKTYIEFKGTDDQGAEVSEVIPFDLTMFGFNNFNEAPQQSEMKEMTLSFSTSSATVSAQTINAASMPSKIFGSLGGYTVYLEIVLSGKISAVTSDITVYGNAVNIDSIRNSDGQLLAVGSQEYNKVAGLVKSMSIVGYTVEAFRTNTNMRTRGQLVTVDNFRVNYQVPFRSGTTVIGPVENIGGVENDITKLGELVNTIGNKMSYYAVEKLISYGEMLHSVTANGTALSQKLAGIGSYYVNPYYVSDNYDLSKFVDSMSSSNRKADIQAVLVNKIRDLAITLLSESNYKIAFTSMFGAITDKVKVIVATDYRIAKYICNEGKSEFPLDDDMNIKVVSTLNPRMLGKMYITLGVEGSNQDNKPNPLTFGNCLWAPTMTWNVVKTTDNAVNREVSNVPRFMHIVHLPILAQVTISDFAGVLGQIARRVNVVNEAITFIQK